MPIPYPDELESNIAHLILNDEADGCYRPNADYVRKPTDAERAMLEVLKTEYAQASIDNVQRMPLSALVERTKLAAPSLAAQLSEWLWEKTNGRKKRSN